MPSYHEPRDFSLSFAAATASVEIVLLLVGSHWPDAVWRDSFANAAILVAALALVAALVAAGTLGSRPLLTEASVAVSLTMALYATVQGVTYYEARAPQRHAQQIANAWPVLISQNYEHVTWRNGPPPTSPFGQAQIQVLDGRLVVTIDSSRDTTELVSPILGTSPVVKDFYLQADVTYMQGPQDGYCLLIFGFERSEHWWALKIGTDAIVMTRDEGGLPHHRIYGPHSPSALREEGRSNHIGIFKRGTTVELFINGRLVATLRDLPVPSGAIWVAPQAANTPDLVECAFDNLALRGVQP